MLGHRREHRCKIKNIRSQREDRTARRLSAHAKALRPREDILHIVTEVTSEVQDVLSLQKVFDMLDFLTGGTNGFYTDLEGWNEEMASPSEAAVTTI